MIVPIIVCLLVTVGVLTSMYVWLAMLSDNIRKWYRDDEDYNE